MAGTRRDTVAALVDQGLVSGLGFVGMLIIARAAGPEPFGIFVLAQGFIFLAASVQRGLVIKPMMAIGPQLGEGEREGYYRSLWCASTGLAGASALMLAGTSVGIGYIGGEPGWLSIALPLAAGAAGFVMQDFVRRRYLAREATAEALVSDIMAYGTRTTCLGTLAATGSLDAATALWAVAAGSAVAVAAEMAHDSRRPVDASVAGQEASAYVIRHWAMGKWLVATHIMQWINGRAPLYAAGMVMSSAAAGYMGAALNLVGTANVLMQAVENVVPVRAARILHERRATGLRAYVRRVTVLGGVPLAAVVILLALGGDIIMEWVYGAEYASYGFLVGLWGIYYLFQFLQRPAASALRAMETTHSVFLSNVFGTLVMLGATGVLLVDHGVGGATLAAVLGQAVVAGLLMRSYRSHARAA